MKIVINGKGGHGVKFGAHLLGLIAAGKGKQASISYEYDAAIRGQNITAFIIISDNKILNPVVEEPDIIYNAEEFEKEAVSNFGSNMYTTMLILGKILNQLNLTINKNEFEQFVEKEKEINWKALNHCK